MPRVLKMVDALKEKLQNTTLISPSNSIQDWDIGATVFLEGEKKEKPSNSIASDIFPSSWLCNISFGKLFFSTKQNNGEDGRKWEIVSCLDSGPTPKKTSNFTCPPFQARIWYENGGRDLIRKKAKKSFCFANESRAAEKQPGRGEGI